MINTHAAQFQNHPALNLTQIPPFDFVGLMRVVWYGKYLIAGCIIFAVTIAGYYAFAIAEPRYAATTTLTVNTQTTPALDLEQALAGQITDPAQINTQVAILRSPHLLVQVVAALDLVQDPEFNRYLTPTPVFSVTGVRDGLRRILSGTLEPPLDQAAVLQKTAENLGDAITARTQRDTYIFQITATTNAPAKSARIANELAQVYLADQMMGKHLATQTAVNWLSDRVYDLQLELEAKETAVNDLIAAERVQDTTVFDALSRQADDNAERLAAAKADLAAAQTALQQHHDTAHPAAASDRTAGSMPGSRQQANVVRYRDQVAALSDFQTELDRKLAEHSVGLIRLQQLRREADATRVIYQTFLARLQETSVQRGLQNPDSRVLTTANPGAYVAPRKMVILAIAALLGALAGISIVVVRHRLHDSFTDPDQLSEMTALPVMAQIPRFARKRGVLQLHYLRDKPASAAAESIRSLRTSLLIADPVPQIILSTSSIPAEGKTTLSLALAQNLADLGKSVLVIEADLRNGSFGAYVDDKAHPGLADVLQGQSVADDAIFHVPLLGADVLIARRMGRNPADLFTGAALATLLAELRKKYDHIILDAPPVLPVPDAQLLAQHVDRVLFTVRWNKTPCKVVQAALDRFAKAGAPKTDLVFAQVDGRKTRHYGGTYFAKYGHAYYQS